MGDQSPICMLHIVRGKGEMILPGRENRNWAATKLSLKESLIRLCMENPNRITMPIQKGNWIKRGNPRNKLLLELGHPTGHSAAGKYAKYRHLPKGKSEFPPYRLVTTGKFRLLLSRLFDFAYILSFFFCVETTPPPRWSLFYPVHWAKIPFLKSPPNNMQHSTCKSRLPPHYENEQFIN